MLFRDHASTALAISQPTHAWISGQILRAWDEKIEEPLLLATEQHDIGWLDWETTPSFDPHTGRPHLFRDIGASVHAPMWARGVERALGAWGTHVALLISRHGGVIYRRFTDRHRVGEADAAAAERFLTTQAPIEAAWARALALDAATLDRDTALLAFADTLSLALCGELKVPLELEAPDRHGGVRTLRLTQPSDDPAGFELRPWPFRGDELVVEGEARPLPLERRLPDAAAMRTWLSSPERVAFRARAVSASHP
jgi:hypothetical protein